MKSSDPLGASLNDFTHGNTSAKLIVKSNITEDSEIPVEYLFRDEEEMPLIERKALALCRGKVLDVGAAAGCHSVLLQQRGLEVFPIDISAKAVEVMKNRGLTNARQADFFELTDEKYDTLLFMMNGIGICGELENLDRFFKKAKELLNPGGQILLDSSDIIYMYEEDDGSVEIDMNAAYYGEVEYQMQYGDCAGPKFNWLFVDFETLSYYADRNGFTCELILEGEHYDYLARLRSVG
jgi:SAM-dependent methyltransferase